MHTVAHRRYIVLAVLVVQNTSLVLMMRASRTAMIGKQDALYTPSTAGRALPCGLSALSPHAAQ